MAEKQRILAIGDKGIAAGMYPDALIDAAILKPRHGQNGYDAVVAYLVLNKVHSSKAAKTIGMWKEAVRPGGSLHIFTPSLEWAAAQILSETPSNALHMHLYGGDVPNNYMSGYRMMDLRILCELNQLAVVYARVGTYQIANGEEIFECDTNYVMAIKPKKEETA